MSSPIRYEMKNVNKSFGSISALQEINFSIAPGEVVALLGDNGAGKSTLIKLISGYYHPTQGDCYWEGEPIRSEEFSPKEAKELGIQTVYQHLGLVEQLSIWRNFFLGMELTYKFGPVKLLAERKMRSIVQEQIRLMGITRPLNPDDSVAFLSGGERQALAIARAKFFGAKLLILDEPTSALSLRQTQNVLDFIKSAAQEGISIIFITHTLHHLEGIIDKINILYHGKMIGEFRSNEISVDECSKYIIEGLPEHSYDLQ